MRQFELKPIDGRKSFNRKAIVIEEKQEVNGRVKSTLISYNTKVAFYDHQNNVMTVLGYFSSTTARHINAFLDFYGFDTCTKKELMNYK